MRSTIRIAVAVIVSMPVIIYSLASSPGGGGEGVSRTVALLGTFLLSIGVVVVANHLPGRRKIGSHYKPGDDEKISLDS